ncbi:VOC family protein [Actinomadura madurae]
MCTLDPAHSTRFYTQELGFEWAGSRPFWGEFIATLQDLPTGADTGLMVTWAVGHQDFAQLELITHTTPKPRPVSPGRLASDHGWVRWGAEVADFDATLRRLGQAGVATLTEPAAGPDGRRRVCCREPGSQVVVEICEAPDARADSSREHVRDSDVGVRYAAASVPDITRACAVFAGLGLTRVPDDLLHGPEDERLWGLAGARRDIAVFTDGDIFLEVLQYRDPAGRPYEAGHLLSDQGFLNVAIGYRDQTDAVAAVAALTELGCRLRRALPSYVGGTYLTTADGLSIEVVVMPREFDPVYGFVPAPGVPAKKTGAAPAG